MTASEAVSLPAFRRIFPNEMFGTTQLSTVASSVIVAVRIRNIMEIFEWFGDDGGVSLLMETLNTCRDEILRFDGSVVRESDDRLVAAFRSSERACEMAIGICKLLNGLGGRHPEVTVAVHRGMMHANMDNGRMEVSGRSITFAQSMLESAVGELVFSADMLEDEHVMSTVKQAVEQIGSSRVAGGIELTEYCVAGRNVDRNGVTKTGRTEIGKESTE